MANCILELVVSMGMKAMYIAVCMYVVNQLMSGFNKQRIFTNVEDPSNSTYQGPNLLHFFVLSRTKNNKTGKTGL